jgi:cysteinyl-tRNA synthetase
VSTTSAPATPVQLHDSMQRKKVPFEPLVPGKVGMYVCGPTPYAPAHIGHAYSAISFDTIRRSLKFLGWDVRYVRNITDVEDKIINAANAVGEDPMALAARFADAYNRDMARFGVLAPDVEPKVSTHIPQIIDLIQKLIDAGKAYPVEGDVYYQVSTFMPHYGKLSAMKIDELEEGHRDLRGGPIDKGKRAPADFALWKGAKPGEPFWDSPWGKGRPGWHIECSAMTHSHLGDTFDLHGGGKDLIFPHHENEIAQSQGAYGVHTFARYWLHNGFLNFAGEKMSKSLGNVFGCDQIADAVGGEALRFFCVSHHFQSPIEFEVEEVKDESGKPTGVRFRSLEEADRQLSRFYATLHKIDTFLASGGDGGLINSPGGTAGAVAPEAEALMPEVRAALADNFNTPVVKASLHAALAAANRFIDEGKGMDKQLRRRSIARLGRDIRSVGEALGILGAEPSVYLAGRRDRLVRLRNIDVARVDELIAERAAARAAKDFARGDTVRDQLKLLGVEVKDTPQGTTWTVLDEA